MSLIFTSNTQDDYKDSDSTGRLLSARIGIENPADYHNHLTSPLEVKPNSQIAVQSVKVSRQQTYEFTEGEELLYYFGRPLGSTLKWTDVTSRPTLISVPRGAYDRTELATELETQLNDACVSPAVSGNFSVSTSLVGSDFRGYNISAEQNGSEFTDRSASLTTSIADYLEPIGSTPESSSFTLAGGVFTRTGGTDGTIVDGACCGIATDFPLANGSAPSPTHGAAMVVDFTNASISDGEGGFTNASWAIGLTRPTIQTNNDSDFGKNHGNAPLEFIKEPTKLPHYYDYVAVFDAEDGQSTSGKLYLYQGCQLKDSTGTLIPNSFKLHEITYFGGAGQVATAVTNASINGGVTTQIEFIMDGDEVKCQLTKGGGAPIVLSDSSQNANASRVFKPTTDFTCALYPKLCLANGTLTISNFDTYSLSKNSYKYPTLTGYFTTDMSGGTYTVGSSPYANYVSRTKLMKVDEGVTGDHAVKGQQPSWGQRGPGFFIKPPDSSAYGQLLPEDDTSTETITFQGTNASGGIAYEHLLVLEDTTPPSHRDQEVGNYFSKMCNFSLPLGFPDISVLDQSVGTLTGLNKITWNSTDTPEFQVNSAFVRISNLNHRTYNSCKNSISKMLYHIPRFTNDGRQFGDLFFEVSEKTYIDLNNTDSFMLNQLQVQICDKNERVVDDLIGDTIVVFHVKQK